MNELDDEITWTKWKAFPDPRRSEMLEAPFGPGVYELRDSSSGKFVLVGSSAHCAYRMTSLLPHPFGQGVRKNAAKRKHVFENISGVEYRTCASSTVAEARSLESRLRAQRSYLFGT
jgi:hypothetical protein